MQAVFWATEAAIRMFCSSAYGSVTVAGLLQRALTGVHKQAGSLDTGPVELLEGPRDVAHGNGGVDVSKPCLQRVGVVVGEADHADKIIKLNVSSPFRRISLLTGTPREMPGGRRWRQWQLPKMFQEVRTWLVLSCRLCVNFSTLGVTFYMYL
jgi:hypothetical protein